MRESSFTGKRALVLGASKWQIPLIRAAQSLGLEVIATDRDPNAIGFKTADFAEIADILDINANIEIACKYGIDAVMTDQTDYAMNVVAAVAQELYLPGPSTQVARNCTNKRLMRELTSKTGVLNPPYSVVSSLTEAVEAAVKIGFPLVIKPTDNQGSRGVFKITNFDDLVLLFDESIGYSREGLALVEGFMTGTEVTVEGFVADGILNVLAISAKKHSPPPRIIAMNLEFPPSFPARVIDSIRKTACDTAQALGMTNGPFHGEFIVNQKGSHLVEAAHRGGGSGTSSHIVPAISGVNILDKLVRVSLGHKVTIKPSKNNACILQFLEFQPGPVQNIKGLPEARRINGVVLFEINYGPGEVIPEITDDSKRHGAVIVTARTIEEAKEILRKSMSLITIDYSFFSQRAAEIARTIQV
jgi:biotin carboxylase